MKIWTSQHVFNHNWETVTQSQWRKYPNPLNTNVLGTDVVDRYVDESGVLHSHRIITTNWGLAPWVQKLIGADRECHAHEYSKVDVKKRHMELRSVNLTFCSFVSMKEQMSYFPLPDNPQKTLMRQETLVTVKGVPLTSYMESLIVNTVSKNAGKGRAAIDWMVGIIGQEPKSHLSGLLDKLSSEIHDLKTSFGDHQLLATARSAVEDLQNIHRPLLRAEDDHHTRQEIHD